MHRFNAIRHYLRASAFFFFAIVSLTNLCSAQLEIDGWLESSSWTDVSGKFKIEATFVRLDQQNVILKKSDGKEISVPLGKLNEESRRRATEAAKKKSAAAPTTNTAPMSSAAAAAKSPMLTASAPIVFPANLDAKPFMDFVFQQVKDGRPIVVWDAMPVKYQNDINRVVKLAAEKVDPSLVKPVLNTAGDIVKILRTKKSFVLNTPMLQSVLTDKDLANKLYDPGVDLFEAYLPVDLLDQKNLSGGDLRPVLETYFNRLTEKAKTLEAAVPKDNPAYEIVKATNWENFKYEMESSAGDTAVLVIKGPNAPEQKVDLVRVSDRWLPKPMVEDWDTNMEQAVKELGKITPQAMAQAKQSMQMPLAFVSGIANSMLQANDQASFDQAVAGVMSMLPMMGGMPMQGMQPGMPMPGIKPPAP